MKTATHYLPGKDGSFRLYYREAFGTYNTGEPYKQLQYLTFCDLWHGSLVKDQEEFIKNELIKIPDTKPHNLG